MKNLFWITLICSGLFLTSSCSKDEDEENDSSKSKTEHLTASNWYLRTHTINPGLDLGEPQLITELVTHLGFCAEDNFWVFEEGGNLKMNAGAVMCEPMVEEQEMTGSWGFLNNETQLALPGGLMDVKELNATTMVLEYSLTFQGTTTVQVQTFTH